MDLPLLLTQLRAAFPTVAIDGPLVLLGEGFSSHVVETSNGLVFRVAKDTLAQGGHEREHQLLPLLQQVGLPLQIPQLVCFLTASNDFRSGVVGYAKLPGRPLSPTDVTAQHQQRLAQQLASFITALHGVPIDAQLEHVLPSFPPPPDRLAELWANVANDLAHHLSPAEVDRAQVWAEAIQHYRQRYPYSPTLVHGDLWYENLLVDAERGVLVGVLDFEQAAMGDPVTDLMTQHYISQAFADQVAAAYFSRNSEDVAARSAHLLAVRELLGLERGIHTQTIDADSLAKVRQTLWAAVRFV